MSNPIQQTFFGQDAVKQLDSSDFDGVELRDKQCYLVLFYTQNSESLSLIKIWQTVASEIPAPHFGAVNLMTEKKVADAFMNLRSDSNSPLHWASLKNIPCILVFRGGWPVAFYNGEKSVQSLADYALTLACEANYREPVQLAVGSQSDITLKMPNVKPNETPITSSVQFNSNAPLHTPEPVATPISPLQ